MEPILKWAGGKRKLIAQLINYVDIDKIRSGEVSYFEPFIGGGSFCFYLSPKKCFINDFNAEIANLYKVIKNKPKKLIETLGEFSKQHSKEFYYHIRNMDREPDYTKMSDIVRAARMIYLNKTCYNGLYRVNAKGFFNVPMGRYVNPDIIMKERILSLSKYLKSNSVKITQGDFVAALSEAQPGDYIYLDPPYDYDNIGFTSYVMNGFNHEDLKRLKTVCDELVDKGCHVIISNNDTKFVNSLFKDKRYKIEHIEASRFISCDGKQRKKAKEVIIHG